MGLQFGNLPVRIRRVAYYSLSSLEQRAWAKSITPGISNLLKRGMRPLSMILPGLIMSVATIKWANAEYRRCNRKNPKLYENDK